MTAGPSDATLENGALAGVRVVELASEMGALAGKLMADMGADVILVEPPGGDPSRNYPPFLDDEPGPDRSLFWWHYQTSKRGIVLDLEEPGDRARFTRLVASADVLLECEAPDRLSSLGLDYPDLSADHPELILVSITGFGRNAPRRDEPFTDLTLLANGGPAWSCGYDDHSLPPIRGGGNQGYQTACHYAFLSALTALLHREVSGRGQHIDVNAFAATNVTTEMASYHWLVAQGTVQRQTGRHAQEQPTMEAQMQCADGRWLTTGFPPRRPEELRWMHDWMVELGVVEEFPEAVFLEQGAQLEAPLDISKIGVDDQTTVIFGAAREGMVFLASKVPAYELFVRAQDVGISVGIIYSPDEVLEDRHFVERGFPVQVEHPELGRSFTYPGAPYKFEKSPWHIARRAPALGEHDAEVWAELEALE
ncbi:CoA transferase [Myxococcota bacterium]|nr:CoA transferase [Myxococcota bacterium]